LSNVIYGYRDIRVDERFGGPRRPCRAGPGRAGGLVPRVPTTRVSVAAVAVGDNDRLLTYLLSATYD